MQHFMVNDYLQYGALGVVFFQTILFLILGKTILTGAAANRKAYEQLAERTFHLFNELNTEILQVIVKNTESMTHVVESQKDLQMSFLKSVTLLEEDHRKLQTSFYRITAELKTRRNFPEIDKEENTN